MTQKKIYRMAQVNRLLQEEIAEILLTELQDKRLHQLTVTEVRATKDLNHAFIFVTARETKNCKETIETANRSAGYIRKLLFSRLRIKRIPELEFRYDESLDRAERIYKTLSEINPDSETEEQSI